MREMPEESQPPCDRVLIHKKGDCNYYY